MSLFSVPSFPHAVSLRKHQIRYAQKLSNLLYTCGDDVVFWCEELGIDVYEVEDAQMPEGIMAILQDGTIFIRKKLSFFEQVISIAHEIFHKQYHGTSVAYRDTKLSGDEREESEAESFALLVAEPNMWKYDTIEEFFQSSPLPREYRKMRAELFYKIHQ